MAIAPFELERIAPNRLNILQHDQERDIISLKTTLSRPFINAGRTGTMLPKRTDRIHSLVTVTPVNSQYTLPTPLHIQRL
jgi:hypothetical protein